MAHNKVYGFCESGCKVEVDPAGKVKPVSEGGTGATDAEQARKNIGAASETHKHSADDIGGGTIPIANGGTGGSTAREAEYNICKDIEEVATLSDNNLFVFKRQGSMNATNGAFCTKTVSSIWNYIAQKIRSTFGFSSGGVLPIANGGTGATSAANARAALGITPANIGAATSGHTHTAEAIGAVKKTGDTMTGNFYVPFVGINQTEWPTVAFRDNDGNARASMTVTGTNRIEFTQNKTGNAHKEWYMLPEVSDGLTESKWFSVLTSKTPVTVAQGGTGATTAEAARANLGAVSKTGDTMTGTYTTTGVIAAGWSNARRAGMQSSDIQAYFTSRNTDGTVMNAIYLKDNVTSLGKPLEVASGGTGATNKADALKNLGLEIQTGTVNDVNSTGVTVTFPTAFSGVPVVVATGSSEQSSVQVKNVTKTRFTIESPMPNNDGCQWIAIYKA